MKWDFRQRSKAMRNRQQLALGILLGTMALGLASLAYSQAPSPYSLAPPPREETLTQRLARTAKVPEDEAKRLFAALGPVIREELTKGREISIPGLGAFRIVRVAEHRDLRNGRPVTIPAVNTVEFVAEGITLDLVNSETAQPAETVPRFNTFSCRIRLPANGRPRSKCRRSARLERRTERAEGRN
jgi:nucleoid DNA-binding protein